MTTAHNFGKHSSHVLNLSTRITTAKIVNFMQKNGNKWLVQGQITFANAKKVTTTSRLEFIINHRYQTITEWLITICSDCDCSWFLFHFLFFTDFFSVARIVCARRFRVIINREVSHIESNLHLLSVKQAAVAMKIWLCANCNSGSTAATTTQK